MSVHENELNEIIKQSLKLNSATKISDMCLKLKDTIEFITSLFMSNVHRIERSKDKVYRTLLKLIK